MRRDHVLQNALGLRIGQYALHAASGFYAQAPQRSRIVLGDDQDHAVIHAFAPQFPCVSHADTVLLDRFRFGAID